jgi:hypothetical protein
MNREEELERELTGVQQMLGSVLQAIGNPVRITKEDLRKDLPKGIYVDIEDEGDAFVFSLKVAEDE